MSASLRLAGALLVVAAPLAAQTGGAIAGRVRDALTGGPVRAALVSVDGGRQGAATDTGGAYRVREVRSGWHRVQVNAIGYRPLIHDSVLVRSGETITLNFELQQHAVAVDSILVEAKPDVILDPLATQDIQRITAEEIRRLPVTTLEDPDAMWVHDLVGARVVGVDGTDHGVVTAVEANPASDLLVLDGGGLVPLRFVVTRAEGVVTIDPPAGLFDLD